MNHIILLGKANFPLEFMWLDKGKKITHSRLTRKKKHLVCAHGNLIEIGPKKWPKQIAFTIFRQRNNKCVKN